MSAALSSRIDKPHRPFVGHPNLKTPLIDPHSSSPIFFTSGSPARHGHYAMMYLFDAVTARLSFGVALVIGTLTVLFFLSNTLASRFTPSRLNPHQAPKSKYGLHPVINNPPPKAEGIDVIFVHGLGSNPDATWSAKRTRPSSQEGQNDAAHVSPSLNWVTELLPEDIPDNLKDIVRLYFYNYDSYWQRDAVNNRLSMLGDALIEHINDTIRSMPREKARKLVFVAHSYGGIVVKKALVSARKNPHTNHITEQTIATFFLGTPHSGSSFSRFGRIQARFFRLIGLGASTSLLDDLEEKSTVLMDLHRDFVTVVGKNLQVINFFETLGQVLGQVGSYRPRQFVVDESSATFAGKNVKNIGLGTTHSGLNKFGSRDDGYTRITSNLTHVLKKNAQPEYRVFSVPLELTPTFTERPTLQDSIRTALSKNRDSTDYPHAVAITGMGGTGKSQLALSYAHTNKQNYNPILWIDATSEETTQASFRQCLEDLKKLPAFSTDHGDGDTSAQSKLLLRPEVKSVLQWLKSRSDAEGDDPWLVIVDNADDLSWGIGKVFPKGKLGNLVITSQDRLVTKIIPKECDRVAIDIMEESEASSLLLKHMQLDEESASEDVRIQCGLLTEKLGYLALAVGLAGYHIANEEDPQEGLKQYLSDYESHQDDILKNDELQGLTSSEKTIWSAWDASLARIEKLRDGKLARTTLIWLAQFNGTVVYKEVVTHIFTDFSRYSRVGDTKNNDTEDSDTKYDDTEDDDTEHDGYVRFPEAIPKELAILTTTKNGAWDNFHYRNSCRLLLRYGLVQKTKGIQGAKETQETKDGLADVTMHKLVRWRALKEDHDNIMSLAFTVAFDTAYALNKMANLHWGILARSAPAPEDVLRAVRMVRGRDDGLVGYNILLMYEDQERYKEHQVLVDLILEVATEDQKVSCLYFTKQARDFAIDHKNWDAAMGYHNKYAALATETMEPVIAKLVIADSLCKISTEQKEVADATVYGDIMYELITEHDLHFEGLKKTAFLSIDDAVSTLFELYSNLGRNTQLKKVLEITIELAYQHFPPTDEIYVLSLKDKLVLVLERTGDSRQAEANRQELNAIRASGKGMELPLKKRLDNLMIAMCDHLNSENHVEAEGVAKEWLDESPALGLESDGKTLFMLAELVDILLKQEKYKEAKVQLDRCREWLAKHCHSCTDGTEAGSTCAFLIACVLMYSQFSSYVDIIKGYLLEILKARRGKGLPTSKLLYDVERFSDVAALFEKGVLDQFRD